MRGAVVDRFVVLVAVSGLAALCGCEPPGAGPSTIAEVEVIRPSILLDGKPVIQRARFSDGGVVTAGPGARAFVHHDASARALLDGGSRLRAKASGFVL